MSTAMRCSVYGATGSRSRSCCPRRFAPGRHCRSSRSIWKRGHGEASIGTVYAANTVGAIAGVFCAVHVGLPLLGLKGLLTLGGALDVALGVVLLWMAAAAFTSTRVPRVLTAAGAVAIGVALLFGQLDTLNMASGVYRHGTLLPPGPNRVLFH